MLENPFLTRDLRALSRKGFGPIVWPLAVQNLLLFLPFWILERVAGGRLHPADAWQGFALVGLGLAHAAPLGAMAWILGARVFGLEHRLRTLEGLRLIAVPPGRWLMQKLAFPLAALALVWAAAYPIYAAMIVRGHFVPRELTPGMLLAGCAGILVFGAALLSPPEGLRSPIRDGVRVSRSVRRQDAILLALPLWIALIILKLSLDWMAYALDQTERAFPALPFFHTMLPTGVALALLLAGYAVCCAASAYATAHPADPRAAGLKLAGRAAGVGTAALLFMGYAVSFAYPALFQATALLAAFAVALPARDRGPAAPARKRAVEDPMGARELAILDRLLHNPVLTRDLRATLRTASLTRNLLVYAAAITAGSILLGDVAYSLIGWGGRPTGSDRFWRTFGAGAFLVGSWFILPATLAYGGRSLGAWGVDRRCSTLPQVFATPLPTADFVRGRWGAALLVGFTRALPVPVSFLGGLYLLQGTQEMEVILAHGYWLLTLGLILSAGLAGSAQNSVEFKDLLCAGCLSVYVVMLEGMLYMWRWTQVEIVNGLPDRTPLAVFCCMLVPINFIVTFAIHRVAIRDIELLRERELEMA